MTIAARLDDYGKPAWLALMIVSFILFWPLGLFILFYMLWSGRMGSWSCSSAQRHKLKAAGKWYRAGKSSGNSAFDQYKEATLRRLEDEQEEFLSFLDKLRQSRDKAEFDQYMAERAKDVSDSGGDVEEGAKA